MENLPFQALGVYHFSPLTSSSSFPNPFSIQPTQQGCWTSCRKLEDLKVYFSGSVFGLGNNKETSYHWIPGKLQGNPGKLQGTLEANREGLLDAPGLRSQHSPICA